jgi:hypothetical protein
MRYTRAITLYKMKRSKGYVAEKILLEKSFLGAIGILNQNRKTFGQGFKII